MSTSIKRALTIRDALDLRRIRNTCACFMTRDTRKIGVLRQLLWWARRDAGRTRAYLVYADWYDAPVGYTLLSQERGTGRWFITVGFLPFARGLGLGTWAYWMMQMVCPGDALWAEIRKDNPSSIRAAAKAGFSLVWSSGVGRDDVIQMVAGNARDYR